MHNNPIARRVRSAALAASLALATLPMVASADDRRARDDDGVRTFAVLPDGLRFPEGITANPRTGDIFVGTFDFGPNANALLRYDDRGRLQARRDFGGTPLLGLAFGPRDGKVYVANFGASQIQRIAARFDATSAVETVATVPALGAPADRSVPNPDGSSDTIKFGSNRFPAPNAMVFDKSGNLYVSDSFQGAIWRIDNAHACAAPCAVALVKHDPLLATAGFPPFGANGLALARDGGALYIANTGDDRVLKLDLAGGALSVFAESVNGADGLAMDAHGLLWVAANQADALAALNDKGRVVAGIGAFDGIDRDGAPDGLLFPASLVIVGRDAFIANLALPLTPAVGDEPEEDVTRWTISRVRLKHLR